MSDQTKIQTAGPADPNAPLAQKFYTIVTGLLGLVGIASVTGLVTADQVNALNNVGTTGVAFAGAAATAVAAFRTRKQVKNGTFDPAPTPVEIPVLPPPMSPVEKITSAVEDARNITTQVGNGLSQLQDIVGVVPGLVSMTPDVPGPLDDLIRGAAAQMKAKGR